MLQATWQVTFDDVVLLAFEDFMSREPAMSWGAEGEPVKLVRAAHARQQAYGNVTNSIRFSAVKVFDDAADARAFLLDHAATLPTGVADATIETTAAISYTLANARLLPMEPRIEDGCRFVCDYTLVGGAITAD